MYHIAALGGDGVGPELIEHGLRVLSAVAEIDEFKYEVTRYPHSGAHYRATGEVLDDRTIEEIGQSDALFFGSVGDPALPLGLMERGILLRLAQRLDLGISVRPGRLHAEHLTPLKDMGPGDIDMVIVRDGVEDCFPLPGGILRQGTSDEVSVGLLIYTRKAVEQATRYALRLAQRRRRKLMLVTQSNGVPAQAIWPRTLKEVAPEYPDVEVREVYADTGNMMIATAPKELDVILTTNWLGGILCDLMGGMVGGIGLIGSARINLERNFGLFEPAHGSAPKYAGQDKVSPMATLNALAMLLDTIGEPKSARRIERAIADVLGSGRVPNVTTRCPVGTTAATDAVIEALTRV